MSLLRNDGLTDQLHTLNTVIRKSYSQAKKQLQDGMHLLQDEFRDFRDQAEACIDYMSQPVNNFLKDLSEIDQDFRREVDRDSLQFNATTPRGNIIPIDQALKGCMEQNY